MLDLRFVLQNLDLVRERTAARRTDFNFDAVVALAEQRREAIYAFETTRAEQKKSSGAMKSLKPGSDAFNEMRATLKEMSNRASVLDEDRKRIDAEISELLLHLPNLLQEAVPVGASEDDNVVVATVGSAGSYEFPVLDHVDIGEGLGIFNFEAAAKVSGARFVFLCGAGARLERALINFMLDIHTREHGYEEMWTPFIVSREAMTGTGQLPKFEEDAFRTDSDHFLIPTGEVPLTNFFRDELMESLDATVRVCGFTPCFRSEAGSHGRDTRGLIRQHQFDKVELVKVCRPENSNDEHDALTADACSILDRLELPYRKMELCSADVGFGAARCFDLEVWLPSQETYREISSCSNFESFQSRRAGIRFRDEDGRPQFAHTINGSGLAVGRTMVALLENFQEADGSVTIPDALRPWFGADRITRRS